MMTRRPWLLHISLETVVVRGFNGVFALCSALCMTQSHKIDALFVSLFIYFLLMASIYPTVAPTAAPAADTLPDHCATAFSDGQCDAASPQNLLPFNLLSFFPLFFPFSRSQRRPEFFGEGCCWHVGAIYSVWTGRGNRATGRHRADRIDSESIECWPRLLCI